MQAMADTAALDVARYIDVADWSPTINGVPNGAGPSAQYLNGKLAYADTDNGSNAHAQRDAGRVAERQLHPPGAEGRHSGPNGPMLVLQTVRRPPVQRGQGHGNTDGAADLRGRPPHGEQVLHCDGLAGIQLRHRFLPRLRQLAAVRRPERAPGHVGRHGERLPPRVPGVGQHLGDGQSAHYGFGRAADVVQRADDVIAGFTMASHLE